MSYILEGTAMRLYHFTWVAHLPAMLELPVVCTDGVLPKGERGITPSCKDSHMTKGHPVVWLTSRDSLMPTTNDIKWVSIAREIGLYEEEEAEELMKRGTCGDRTLRLTVELGNSKRLRHYGTWVDDSIKSMMTPAAITDWWIYFGTIHPDRIVDIQRTAAPHCNDAERDLWEAMEKSFTTTCEAA
jgi:hypothetical protein